MTSLCHQSPASSLTDCFSGQTGGINYNNTVQSNTTIPNCRSSQCDNKPYKMLGTTLFFFKLELNSGKAETRFAKEQKHKIKGFQSAAVSVSAYTNLPCMAVVSYSRSMWGRTW